MRYFTLALGLVLLPVAVESSDNPTSRPASNSPTSNAARKAAPKVAPVQRIPVKNPGLRQEQRLLQQQRRARRLRRQRQQKEKLERCQKLTPQLQDRLPFGPGEEIGFVVSLAGVYVGHANLRVDERGSLFGHVIYPVHGRVNTNSFFKKMTTVESHMTSMVTPDGVLPIAMFSRSASETRVRTEEASFDPVAHTVTASLAYGDRVWRGTADGAQPIQDVISVIYFARSRQVTLGQDYCVELYYGKRLWVARGTVAAKELVSTPAGAYSAYKVEGEAVRDGHRLYKRAFTVWLSDDEDRLPVKLTAPSRVGEIEVRVDHFKRGRRLVKNGS